MLSSAPRANLGDISRTLAGHGLVLRGGFNFAERDEAPPGPSGLPAKALLLVGQAGGAPWPHFQRWLGRVSEPPSDPLDRWCREIIGAEPEKFGARAFSPPESPYL
ncbi:MAG: hypothetical protein DIU65_11305, partial [Proteobacteria bacterium]